MARDNTAPQPPTSFSAAWLRTLAGTVQALVMSVPSEHARRRVVRLAREFGYDHRPGLLTLLPQVAADEVVANVPIRVRAPVAADGNVTTLELVVINTLVAARAPRQVFEIGTYDGRTTLNIAANAPADAVVHTLDLPTAATPKLNVAADDVPFIHRSQHGVRGSRFRGAAEAARIRELEGDSATFDYAPYAGHMDFVFVDGSHAYEYVLSDSANALRMAAPGAVVLWHDYGEWPGVTKALHVLHGRDRRFARLRHVAATSLVMLEV